MRPKSIGIIGGDSGPMGALSILHDMVVECRTRYGSCHSYEYPCIQFYSFPYSEIFLIQSHSSRLISRELGHCIRQLEIMGMDLIVIPSFTLSSYLTFRQFDCELIEMGTLLKDYLVEIEIGNPFLLCSNRTRESRYCETFFECRYPERKQQNLLSTLIEDALKGEKIDINPLLKELPFVPIVSASITLNAYVDPAPRDPRWINFNKVVSTQVVKRSFENQGSSLLS